MQRTVFKRKSKRASKLLDTIRSIDRLLLSNTINDKQKLLRLREKISLVTMYALELENKLEIH